MISRADPKLLLAKTKFYLFFIYVPEVEKQEFEIQKKIFTEEDLLKEKFDKVTKNQVAFKIKDPQEFDYLDFETIISNQETKQIILDGCNKNLNS